jgi:hypothetical protein
VSTAVQEPTITDILLLDFELSNIEMAIITRSTEGLQSCLLLKQGLASTADLDDFEFCTLLLMCLGWVPGILLLLDSTLPRPAWVIEHCFQGACQYHECASALLLLEYIDGISTHHLAAAVTCGDIKVLETVIYELSTRRYQLQEVAQQLPVNTILSLGLPTEGLLDTRAYAVQEVLEQHDISIEPRLHTDWGSLYSAIPRGGTTAANILYTSGFTDLNQCDTYDLPPLAYLGRVDSSLSAESTLEQFLDLACWMVGRGASLHHLQSVEGCAAILHFAENLADRILEEYLNLPYQRVPFFELALKSKVQSLNVDNARLLQAVLSDNTKDNCSCACSEKGCSPVTRLLRRFCERRRDSPMFSGLCGSICLRLQEFLSERFLGNPNPIFISSAIRYLTFDVMDLTHTCHASRYDDPIDPEEAREIREEESELIDQLEALVVKFSEKYDELRVGILDFFKGYWKTRMSEVLTPAWPDEGVLRRAQEIGIISSEEPEASLDRVLYWVAEWELPGGF